MDFDVTGTITNFKFFIRYVHGCKIIATDLKSI